MKINKILLIVFLFFTSFFYAQNKGISYQAVFYNPEVKSYPGQDVSTTPLAETDICLRFTILDESKLMEYEETLKVKTDKYGMVTTSIGTGTKIGGYANSFDQIVWGAANKILAVSVDKSGYCNSFIPVSESSFDAVPFSFSSISAVHVSGVVGVNNGGTGAVDAAVARVNLGAESVANKSTDINADWDSDVKFPSVKSIKKYVDLQTSAGGYGNGSITNEKLAVDAVTDDKVANGINKSKVGLSNVDNTSDLDKPLSSTTSSALATKENITNKSVDIIADADSEERYPSVKSIKTYVDVKVTGATIADADSSSKGKIQLAGDLSGTAEAPTVPGLVLKATIVDVANALALKEDVSNKSVNVALDGASDVMFPSVKSIKTYVDVQVAGVTIVDADSNSKGKIQLAGDLAGTAEAPTVPGLVLKATIADVTNALALKEDITNKSTDVALDGASDVMFPSVKSIKTYVDVQISDEVTRAGLAETANTTLISSEAILARSNEMINTSAISAEVTRAGLAELANTSLILDEATLARANETANTTVLNFKANIASPTFTGVPNAPTATLGTNTTQIATTQFVTAAMAASLNITSEQLGDYTATATDDIILMTPTDGVDHTITFPTGIPIGKKIYVFYYNSFVHSTVSGASVIVFSPIPIGSVPNLQMGFGATFMYLGGSNWMSCTNN